MILHIHEENPQQRLIDKAVAVLRKGGVIIYPTDTVYAYGCDLMDKHAIERIYRIKKLGSKKPLSFIFTDIAGINDYVLHIPDRAYKIMKKAFPGPYTMILRASKLVPKIAITHQKTIGVRIPDNSIALALVRTLGRPIISASVSNSLGEYVQEPGELEKVYRNEVDLVIDAGKRLSEPSTIIDFTGDAPQVLREGKGKIFF